MKTLTQPPIGILITMGKEVVERLNNIHDDHHQR